MTSQRDGDSYGPPGFPSVDGDATESPTRFDRPASQPSEPSPWQPETVEPSPWQAQPDPPSPWQQPPHYSPTWQPPADQTPGYLAAQPMPVQQQPGGGGSNRKRWAVAGIATIVVIALVGGLFVFLGARPATPSLVSLYAPAGAAAYVEFRYDMPGDQADNLAEFMSHFPGFADQAAFATKLDETIANMIGQTNTGLDWATDIKPWFGGQIGVSTTGLTATMESLPSFTLVFSVSDKAMLDEFVGAHLTEADLQQETYNGDTLYSGNVEDLQEQISFTATNEALVVSSSLQDLKDALDTKADTKPGLADDQFFLTQLSAMHADRLGLAYYDYGSLYESMMDNAENVLGANPLDSMFPEGCMDSLQAATQLRFLGELRAEPDHMALGLRIEIPTGEGLPPTPTNRNSNLISSMPGTTLGYYEVRDAGATIGYLIEQLLGCLPDEVTEMGFDPSQIQTMLGVEPAKFFDFLVDAGVAVTVDGDKFGGGMIATVDDEAVASARVSTLLSFVRIAAGGMGPDSAISISEVQHGTTTITVITVEPTMVLPGEPNPATPMSIAVAVANGRVYLGVDDFVTKALDQQASDSLASNAHLQSAISQVGAENTGIVFLDIERVVGWAESQMLSRGSGSYELEAKPFIDPFAEFIQVSRNVNGVGDAHVFLYVE